VEVKRKIIWIAKDNSDGAQKKMEIKIHIK